MSLSLSPELHLGGSANSMSAMGWGAHLSGQVLPRRAHEHLQLQWPATSPHQVGSHRPHLRAEGCGHLPSESSLPATKLHSPGQEKHRVT